MRSESQDRQEKIVMFCMGFVIFYLALELVSTKAGGIKNLIVGDVEFYYNIYNALKNNSLTRDGFRYGIGFPIMGFFSWNQDNPFIVFSMLIFATSFYHIFLISRHFLKFNFALISSIFIIATAPFLYYYILSQNIIITSTLIIYLSSLIIREKGLNTVDSVILGFLFGIDFASRYIDPILLIPGLLFPVHLSFKKNKNHTVVNISIFSILFISWIIVTLYYHKEYLGEYFKTPYAFHYPFVDRVLRETEDIFTHMKFHYFNNIIRNFYQVFINPYAYALSQDIENKRSLIIKMPYILVIFSGIYYWINDKKPQVKGLISLALIFLSTFIFYCSFWPFTAHDLKYECLRYLSGWYPIAGIFSLFGIKKIYYNFKQKNKITDSIKYGLRVILIYSVIIGISVMIPIVDKWYINKLSYPKQNWAISTNKNNKDAYRMIDNDFDDRWTTGSPMQRGDYIMIDTNQLIDVSEIRFDLRNKAEHDFPPKLTAFYSSDGVKFEEIKHMKTDRQNHIWILKFSKISARSLKIEVVDGFCRFTNQSYWWSIYELDILT